MLYPSHLIYDYHFHFVSRKELKSLVKQNTHTSLVQSANGIAPEMNLTNLALKILPSKNGLVLRRLLMTAVSAFTSTYLYAVAYQHFTFYSKVCVQVSHTFENDMLVHIMT